MALCPEDAERGWAKFSAYTDRTLDIPDAPKELRRFRAEADFKKACEKDDGFAERYFAEHGPNAPRELWID